MTPRDFNDLPDEVVSFVLRHLDPISALRLGRTSRRFRDLTDQPLLWKYYCQSCYRYWSADQNVRKREVDPNFVGWKDIFSARARSARRSRTILEDVITDPLGRIGKIDQIVDDGDYGVKNELLDAFQQAPNSTNHLAQK